MNDLHILIVDDHALVREGLKARLLAEPGVVRVTEAADADDPDALARGHTRVDEAAVDRDPAAQ